VGSGRPAGAGVSWFSMRPRYRGAGSGAENVDQGLHGPSSWPARPTRCRLLSLSSGPTNLTVMCDTGLFFIHEVAGEANRAVGRFAAITSLRATCLRCLRTFNASCPPELEEIGEASILYCCACGTRQALPNSRFDDFVYRAPRHTN
jgi:hypothetical protein